MLVVLNLWNCEVARKYSSSDYECCWLLMSPDSVKVWEASCSVTPQGLRGVCCHYFQCSESLHALLTQYPTALKHLAFQGLFSALCGQ